MATLESLMAALDTLYGFRVFILLSGEDPNGRGATSISVWQSAEHMTSSEQDNSYYGLLKSLLGCGESFSPMHPPG